MTITYKPINMPQRIIKVDDTLPIRLQENFDEIERQLNRLQKYENNSGVPVNDTVSTNTDATGKWLTNQLSGAIDTAANLINSGGGTVIMDPGNGLLIVDDAVTPTKAMRMVAGGFAIADSKDVSGNWIWRTFGTGSGFTADELISGTILSSLVNILGNSGRLKLDGDSIHSYDENGNEKATFAYFEALGTLLAAFTRASTAYLSDGTLVASGVPRYEYGAFYPAIPDDRAVMIEEGTTNVLLQSEAFDAADWVKGGTPVITPNSTVAPNGTTTADTIADNDTAAYEYIYQNKTAADSETWTVYLFIKKDAITSRFPELGLDFNGGTTVLAYRIQINTSTGATVARANGASAKVTVKEIAGYWKLTITGTNNATGNTTVRAFFYPAITTTWGSAEATATGSCVIWGAQLEKKPYPTSYMATTTAAATRAAEVLSIPTTGILSSTEATVEFIWTPQQPISGIISQATSPMILQVGTYYQNNSLVLWAYSSGGGGIEPDLKLFVKGATSAAWSLSQAILASGTGWYVPGTPIKFAIKLTTANTFYVYVNGTPHGPYTIADPLTGWAGNIMYLGTGQSASYPNALYDDTRFSDIACTTQEITDGIASGLPLKVDDYTTYKMNFDDTLQPTIRYFGLYTKNGRFILQDPLTGQGFEVWDGTTRMINIGRLDDGTIGGEFNGCSLFSSLFRTGAETDLTYIALVPPNYLQVFAESPVGSGVAKKQLEIAASAAGGGVDYYVDDVLLGQAKVDDNKMWVSRVGAASASRIEFWGTGYTEIYGTPVHVHGTSYFYGDLNMASGTKNNIEETKDYGKRLLAVRESPEQKYVDEGIAELINGVCVVPVCPIFLECIEPNTENTPWITRLTPKGPFTIYEAEIGDSYFIVKSHETGISGKFSWELSATRNNYANYRLPEVI